MKADQIVERAPGPAIAVDSDNRIVAWNQPARQLFGYGDKQSSVAGKQLHQLLTVTDTFGNPYRIDGQAFWELATRGEPVNNFELHVAQGDAPRTRISVTAIVVLGPGDLEYTVVYLMRPIFRRRRADEAIDRVLSMSVDELRKLAPSDAAGERIEQQLTRREIQVLRLLARGNSNEEIAEALNVSVHTVRSHIQHLLRKLEAHSKLEAVTKASQMRLI
jgi:DNA-binding CsgD family transcriptional regulator